MSTYPTTIRMRARSHVRRSPAVWAPLVAALIGAVLAVVVLAVPENDAPPLGKGLRSQSQPISSAPQPIAPHSRFDGGPNEGTRGALTQRVDSPVVRFDGGPQEGTRGAITAPVQAPTFDRGPRAGHVGDAVSRSVPSPVVSSTRFDGGPEEGTRGR